MAQRTLSFIFKNCEGKIPTPADLTEPTTKRFLKKHRKKCWQLLVRGELDNQRFHKALEAIWDVVNAANVYIDVEAPWSLKKTDTVRMGTVLICSVRNHSLPRPDYSTGNARIGIAKMLDQLKIGAGRDGAFEYISGGNPCPKSPWDRTIDQPQGVFPTSD